MRSDTTKVLHKVGGRSMLDWSLALAQDLNCDRQILVISTHSEELRHIANERVGENQIAIQDPPQGTGHAVQCATPALEGFDGAVIVLYADTPLLPADAVVQAFEALESGAHIAVLGFDANEPGGYGRLICEPNGDLVRIVEAKDASPDELAVGFCNSGVMAVHSKHLKSLLDQLDNNNANGEYYLTDIVSIGRKNGLKSVAVRCEESDVLGVNSRVQLAEAEAEFQKKQRIKFMEDGVTLIDPASVFFSFDTQVQRDVIIEPNVVFGPGVRVEQGVQIRAFSHLEGCTVGEGSMVGPYARLRPGAELGHGVHIGNFVEVKNTKVGDGAKANHLSYLGDGEVGERSNIGAGTIFCNYDGYFKHKTLIGKDVFVGSNSSLVAPVTLGDTSFVGTGSVVTEDVPEGALALARGRQVVKADWAVDYHRSMKAKKEGQ